MGICQKDRDEISSVLGKMFGEDIQITFSLPADKSDKDEVTDKWNLEQILGNGAYGK